MGTDINGYVEVYNNIEQRWQIALDLEWLNLRNYKMFASLFDVRNGSYDFQSVAAHRGLPDDCAQETRNKHAYEAKNVGIHSTSWITWKELEAIDWDEHLANSENIECHFQYQGRDYTSWHYLAEMERLGQLTKSEIDLLLRGEDLPKDGKLYRYFKLRRRDARDVSPHWRILFDVMQAMASSFPERVRLVVWFDN